MTGITALPLLVADRTYQSLGMQLLEHEPGRAVISMVVREDMTNGFAITHGGMVFALADTAFAVACNEDERITVASGADIVFLKSTGPGHTLTATAVRRARTGRNGIYDVTIVDDAGDIVAEFRGRSFTTDR